MEEENLNSRQTSFEETEETSMEDLMKDYGDGKEIKLGSKITVKIIAQNKEGFLADLGTKIDGIIPIDDYAEGKFPEEVKVGAEVKVKVTDMRGAIKLSHKACRDEEVFEILSASFKENKTISGKVKSQIKGGFIVDLNGADAFLPMSQADLRQIKDPKKYLGKTYQFLIAEFDRHKRKLVVSRRKILEKERDEKKKAVLEKISEGQIVDGVVNGVTDFGAFVDLGGIDGLLHIGELAWHKVNKVEDIIKKGQSIRVQIVRINKETEKISLSLRNLMPNPWESAGERFPVGMITKGKVVSVIDGCAFVELEPGIEGFLHNSEYSWNDPMASMRRELKSGMEINVKIISIDPSNKKMSLSVKQTQNNPWEEAFRHYSPGMVVKGRVENLMPFGAFVHLEEGIEGLIHINDFSWTKKIKRPDEMLKKGEEIDVAVLEVNPQKERISLSLKHLKTDPYKKYKVGAVVKGKIVSAADSCVFMEIEEGVEALIRNSESSLERLEKGEQVLKIGDEVEAKIIKNASKGKKLEASVRKLERDRERALLKQYSGNNGERPTLGDILVSESAEEQDE
ncbi:MAG: S1 RNA-binding domain-containing protein [Elusimicrobiota bacterium]|jgi:small subunit ribosomal protein S1|nr:S1 RNA-binding domain-containing protein [Elusimicrobiota bacterium]